MPRIYAPAERLGSAQPKEQERKSRKLVRRQGLKHLLGSYIAWTISTINLLDVPDSRGIVRALNFVTAAM